MTNITKTKRIQWIEARAAELMAKGWSDRGATKRATKEWRLQSPQHVAAEKRNRDLARTRYAPSDDAVLMDAAQVALTGHME